MNPGQLFSYAVVFSIGWVAGHTYRLFAQGWFDKNVWKKVHALGVDWPVIMLALALLLGSTLYWRDHIRWSNYLDCQEELSTAQFNRAQPTVQRDLAQAAANKAQRRLNQVLYDISQTIPLDGKPPTPDEQQAAIDAYARLGPVTGQASAAYDLLVKNQRALDAVRERFPLPDCGGAPT